MRRIIIIFSFCLLCLYSKGQDPHFSQFYASPLNLNPALTGIMAGQYRFNAIYRDQWRAVSVPYKTISASADFRYHIIDQDFYTFGLRLNNDKAGDSGFTQTSAHLSSAYMKQISGGDKDHYVTAGVQLGLAQSTMEWGSLWFGNQFDFTLLSENLNLDSGEQGILTNTGRTEMYLDIGGGLTWFMTWGKTNSMTVGAALSHINKPNVSFLNDDQVSLHQKITGHFNLELEITDMYTIMPAILLQSQGPQMEIVFGSNFRFNEFDAAATAIRVGAWLRLVSNESKTIASDAIVVSAMYEFDRFLLGFSYDITTSGLSPANNRNGGFELSLSYLFPYTQRKYEVRCPTY